MLAGVNARIAIGDTKAKISDLFEKAFFGPATGQIEVSLPLNSNYLRFGRLGDTLRDFYPEGGLMRPL